MEYIKGSFAGKTFPVLGSEKYFEKGTCYIHLDTLQEDRNVVRLMMQTFDEDKNQTGRIGILISQEVAEEIGKQFSIEAFDPSYKIVCPDTICDTL